MKKFVKKISNTLRSEWKGMNIPSKLFHIYNALSVIALFVSSEFFPQHLWLMITVVMINALISMLIVMGPIFFSIGREIFQGLPAEWKSSNRLEKVIYSIFTLGALIICPAVFLHWPTAVLITSALLLITPFIYWAIVSIRKHYSGLRFIESIQTNLQLLKEQLESVDATENKVEALVKLFQTISPLQDAGGFAQIITNLKKYDRKGKYAEQLKALEILQKHFENAGRSIYGINRTGKGEEVTNEKVMIGGVRGLNTFPANYWLECQAKLENDFHPEYKNTWEAVSGYCQKFVTEHVVGINRQIEILKIA